MPLTPGQLSLIGDAIAGAGALGGIVGTLLLLVPSPFSSDAHPLSAWLRADLGALLDWRVSIERPIYRHHRKVGPLLTGAAVLWMWLLYQLSDEHLSASFGDRGGLVFVLLCWLLALLVLATGVIMRVRPSALKPIEAHANRWLAPAPQRDDADAGGFYEHLLNRPRTTGVILLAASVTCLWLGTGLAG